MRSIADAMESKLDSRMKHSFRWRPETAVDREWDDLQDRFGPEGKSIVLHKNRLLMRLGSNCIMDFSNVEWTVIPAR